MKIAVKKYGFILLDTIFILISAISAVILRFDFTIPDFYYYPSLLFMSTVVVITLFLSLAFDCYSSVLSYFGFSEMIKQAMVSFFSGFIILILKLLNIMNLSGSITIIYCGLFFLISCAARGVPRYRRWILSMTAMRYGDTKKVIIVGAGKSGAMVAKKLLDNKEEGFYPIGFLDDDKTKHGLKISGVKVLGYVDTASYYAERLGADEFLIVLPSADEVHLSEVFDKVANANLPTKIFQSAVDFSTLTKGSKIPLKKVSIEDLLFREVINVDNSESRSLIEGKTVLITGGAGSIGSELCRQVLLNDCSKLIIFDINENALFDMSEELKGKYEEKIVLCLGSVRDKKRIKEIFDLYKPQVVFHAAAHKHVPMMEINPYEAVKNNVFGTLNVIEESTRAKIDKFILISTDKAVNPTNIMGATKRICELIVKAHHNAYTECVAVRFGNVLGSNGSVVPLFRKQIENGGPVTVTHKEMTRYFMTIKEAVSLVLCAGSFAKSSELFVLDMGKPVKIYDLAINMIRLSGRAPFKDIDIKIVGIRKGEKMFEELNLGEEKVDKTSHKKIFVMRDTGIALKELKKQLAILSRLIENDADEEKLRAKVFEIIG